jgi:signal transduction histidine kinase
MAQQVAHQIKTPLSSIMLAVQRLQMEYRRDRVDKAKVYDRYVDYVTGEVRRLREVTEDFMKLARLEAPNLCLKDLNAVIQQCLEKLRPRIGERIQIETDLAVDLPQAHLDENQIRAAIEVLLDNSIEALEGQGKLTITTRLVQTLQSEHAKDGAAYVQFEIADTGRGIPAEAHKKLFEPFFTTKEGGTGLGLTIARKIIEDHHGSIEIKSEAGMGTVVFVSLPV